MLQILCHQNGFEFPHGIHKKSLLRGRYALSPEPKCLFHLERKSYRFHTTNQQCLLYFYQINSLKTAVSDYSGFFLGHILKKDILFF